MSNTTDRSERSSAMNYIALAQNVLGQGLRIGHGIVGGEEEEPAYIIDDAPVFHVRRNTPKNEPEFDRTKAFKWGECTHPSLMMGMPDAPGMIKVYVSKVDDFYLMHLSAKLDSWMSGPISPAIRLAAKCPKGYCPQPPVSHTLEQWSVEGYCVMCQLPSATLCKICGKDALLWL
jgi:hypothetical protein